MSKTTTDPTVELDDFYLVDDEELDTQANKFLTFKTGKESYGISIEDIIEIIELQKIIQVPDTPDYVKGVINLRGKIIPVMDVRLRFHLETREYDDRTCIVVVKVKENTIGFIVDTVEEVVEIFEDNITSPPHFKNNGTVRNDYIKGMGKADDQVKILLDVERIMFDDELECLSKLNLEPSVN
ncbi:MAG: chemotaxis protein CheW [Spirochaetes bacterium]|nr:chemotaxis protein CheW [Spirochaetota bacterium]